MAGIWTLHASDYAELVSRQDYKKNLLPELKRIRPLEGTDIIELGAGTGRFTCMLAPIVKSVRAFDDSQYMLEIARSALGRLPVSNWDVAVADNRCIPAESASADIVLAGWTIGLLLLTDHWKESIAQAVSEMRRVLRPGGTIIILEPLGTINETPKTPSIELLHKLYLHLEDDYGFSSRLFRTDYKFASAEEADRLGRLFFSKEVADWLRREKLLVLTEVTGIWWKHV